MPNTFPSQIQQTAESLDAMAQQKTAEFGRSEEQVANEALHRQEFLGAMENIMIDESLPDEVKAKAISLLEQINGYTKQANSLEPLDGGTFMGTALVFSEIPSGYEEDFGRTFPAVYIPRSRMGPGVGGEPVFAAALYVPLGEGVDVKERLVQLLKTDAFANALTREAGEQDDLDDRTEYLSHIEDLPQEEVPDREDFLAEQALGVVNEMQEVIEYLQNGVLPEDIAEEEMQRRLLAATERARHFYAFLYLFQQGAVTTASAPPIEPL